MQGQAAKPKKKLRDHLRDFAPLIKFLLLVVAGGFALLNLQPYIRLVSMMFMEFTPDAEFLQWVMGIPIIGPIVEFIGNLGAMTLAIPLWISIQFFELLPAILKRNQEQIALLIRGIENKKFISKAATDHPYVQKLKDKHNNFPIELLRFATIIASLVYAADALLCFWMYPPIKGDLGLAFMAPSPEDLSMGNLFAALATLFAVEICYHAYTYLTNLLEMFTEKKKVEANE